MKVFLIVILSLTALLCSSFVFTFSLNDDGIYRHKLRWLFITLHSMPARRGGRKYTEKKKTVAKKKEPKKKDKPEFKMAGASQIKAFIDKLVPFLKEAFGEFLGTIRVRRLHMKIVVAGEDSAQAAVNYGELSAACSNALYRLENCISFYDTFVYVEPNFTAEKTKIYLNGKIKIRIISVIAVALKNLVKGLNIYEQAMRTFFTDELADGEKGNGTE